MSAQEIRRLERARVAMDVLCHVWPLRFGYDWLVYKHDSFAVRANRLRIEEERARIRAIPREVCEAEAWAWRKRTDEMLASFSDIPQPEIKTYRMVLVENDPKPSLDGAGA